MKAAGGDWTRDLVLAAHDISEDFYMYTYTYITWFDGKADICIGRSVLASQKDQGQEELL